MVLASAAPALSDDHPARDRSRDSPRQEWRTLAQGRTEFLISDPALVPHSLKLAAERPSCQYREGIQVEPIHFLETANRLLAIVTCWGPIKSHQQVFDLSDRQAAKLLQFPIAAQSDGFSTSIAAPGAVVWQREARLFRSETTSDVIGTPRARYTYRLDAGTDGFVVLRVEYQKVGSEWITLWEAPRWTDLTKRP